MKLQEWRELCRKAWENDYDFLQIDTFTEIGDSRYTIRKSNKTTFIDCTPDRKPFKDDKC